MNSERMILFHGAGFYWRTLTVSGYMSSHSSTVIGSLVTLRTSVTDDRWLEQEVGIFSDIAEQIFNAGRRSHAVIAAQRRVAQLYTRFTVRCRRNRLAIRDLLLISHATWQDIESRRN